MARADERRTQHSLVFRVEGLPSEALVGVEISRFLPRAQIVLQRSVASLQVGGQFPNTPWSIHSLRLLPQRVELDLSATPEVLTLQLLVTADDPPVYLSYDIPPAPGQTQENPTHSANFGVGLAEKLKSAGIEYELAYPGATGSKHAGVSQYLIAKLKAPRAKGGTPVR